MADKFYVVQTALEVARAELAQAEGKSEAAAHYREAAKAVDLAVPAVQAAYEVGVVGLDGLLGVLQAQAGIKVILGRLDEH